MLNKHEIEELIKSNKLIENYIDLAAQLTPNGFDLTINSVFVFEAQGALDFSNKERILPQQKEVVAQKQKPEDKFGWWVLAQGAYKVRTNETVNLAKDLTAICFSRTSLLRMGAFTQHGVWDAGFSGKGEFVLVVSNPHGIKIKQNARIAQLVFLPISEVKEGYNGIYNEKQ